MGEVTVWISLPVKARYDYAPAEGDGFHERKYPARIELNDDDLPEIDCDELSRVSGRKISKLYQAFAWVLEFYNKEFTEAAWEQEK